MKFYSKSKHLVLSIGDEILKFKDAGGIGVFETEDKELIEKLKKHPDNKIKGVGSFFASPVSGSGKKSHIIEGARGSRTEEVADLKALFKKYDALKGEIVKVDGGFRADATEEQKVEYAKLKAEIGL